MFSLSVIIISKGLNLQTYKTVRNVKFLVENTSKKIEVLLFTNILDPVIETKYKDLIEDIKIISNRNIDFIEATNYLASIAKGNNLLFIRSGDYISLNFLNNFFKIKNDSKCIYLSEEKVFFGNGYYTEKNSSALPINKFVLLLKNPYGESFIIKKENFEEIKFTPLNKKYKIGTGFTTFFCNCLEKGFNLKIIPKTVIFYDESKNRYRYDRNYVIPKIKLFDQEKKRVKIEKLTQKDDRIFIKRYLSLHFPNLYNKLFVQKEKLKMISMRIKNRDDKRNILKKIISILFPSLYLKLFLIKQNLKKPKQIGNKYPKWLLKNWHEINEIEPTIFPPNGKLYDNTFHINKNIDKYFYEFMSYFELNIDFLIFCPWLKVGGADKLVINLVKGLKKIFPNKTVGLISTERVSSEMMSYLPGNISFFDFGNNFLDLNGAEREALLLRFIIQISPKKIININSHSLFNLLLKYSKQVSFYSKIYCFCFSPSRTREGQLTGFAFDFIPRIIDDLELVLTDNRNIINVLVDMFGLDEKKFFTVYQPVEINEYKEKDYLNKKEWKILWASRIDYEKLPDVLEKIIINSENHRELTFHIYGNSVMDEQFPLEVFNKHKNAFTYGLYKGGLHGIDYDKYDLFLYTSWFDGMPNTVLEALSIGIPVISSNVGGIKEVIENHKTGYLINDIRNEYAYLDMIKYLMKNPKNLNLIRKNGFKKLQEQHSWDVYLKRLKEIF